MVSIMNHNMSQIWYNYYRVVKTKALLEKIVNLISIVYGIKLAQSIIDSTVTRLSLSIYLESTIVLF